MGLLSNRCDLLVMDEGHRLKNKNSKMVKLLKNFSCRRRVILTGTPLQNNLDELYTCISIINPILFGNETMFKNVFHKPIVSGLAKAATMD